MRFTLADLKKTVSRRKGEVHLVPFLLRPGDLTLQVEKLITLFEGHVGRERVYFSEDRPAELIGDYRLARCLTICLSEWYEWRSPAWPEGATEAECAALHAAGIESSSALRLALYDFVNEAAGGYLAGSERDIGLDTFAASLGLARSTLDDLLRLDADPQQVLERLSDTPPTAAQLAARYNQRAVETVLANAATVEWEIAPRRAGAEPLGTLVKRTCFLARQMGVQYEVSFAQDPTLPSPTRGGVTGQEDTVGARQVSPGASPATTRRAVETAAEGYATTSAYADSQQEDQGTIGARQVSPGTPASPQDLFPPREGGRGLGEAGGEVGRGLGLVAEQPALYTVDTPTPVVAPLDATHRTLVLTLYGPQELTGAPTQYGERLARLCRALLGYRRDASRPGRAALAGDGLRGSARVYLHGRPVTFTLDDRLLRLIERAPQTLPSRSVPGGDATTGETSLAPSVTASPATPPRAGEGRVGSYDSALESQLADEWVSLERERVTAGWQLEREPEPLLAGETILIPDFALRRGERRIFLEIAGYWRPEYRERKLHKLTAVHQTLGDAVPLIVAAPEAARAELGALIGQLPVLWYREYLSAPALLALLEREYNDFDARLATLDAHSIAATVAAHGRIAPDDTYALLCCYTRAELSRAMELLAERLGPDAARWIDGLGLCAPAWHDALLAALRDHLARASDARLPLEALGQQITALHGELASLPESTLETLAHQAGLRVVRSSLFAALVLSAETADAITSATAEATAPVPFGDTSVTLGAKRRSSSAQPRPKAKRKQSEHERPPGYATADLFSPEP